ncbi:MAG: hypothetical protein ACLGGX_02580 [Bdellovibrionia bacterium]
MRKYLILLGIVVSSHICHAGFILDLTTAYESSTNKYAAEGSSSRTGIGGGVYFQASKKFWLGWGFNTYTFAEKLDAEKFDYSSTEMGPSFKWEIGKSGLYYLTGTYNLNIESTAKLDTSEKVLGSSYQVSWGVQPQIGERFRLGVFLTYYSASHGKKVISDVQSSTSYSSTWIYPSLALSFFY